MKDSHPNVSIKAHCARVWIHSKRNINWFHSVWRYDVAERNFTRYGVDHSRKESIAFGREVSLRKSKAVGSTNSTIKYK